MRPAGESMFDTGEATSDSAPGTGTHRLLARICRLALAISRRREGNWTSEKPVQKIQHCAVTFGPA